MDVSQRHQGWRAEEYTRGGPLLCTYYTHVKAALGLKSGTAASKRSGWEEKEAEEEEGICAVRSASTRGPETDR